MTLLLSNLSAPAPLSIAAPPPPPPPVKPDFNRCGTWYSASGDFPELIFKDCMDAWRQLPQGDDLVTWHVNGFPPGLPPAQRSALPMINSGSCQIQLSASGKNFEEGNRFQIRAVPNVLRDIALYTIEACLGDEYLGGYSTHQFTNVVDWITAPDTVFPGDLNLPAHITFITALVWNPEGFGSLFEPGSRDGWTAEELEGALLEAINRAPAGSDLRRSLARRYEYVEGSRVEMKDPDSGYFWWSGPRSSLYPPLSTGNNTLACDPKSMLPGTKECNSTVNDLSSA